MHGISQRQHEITSTRCIVDQKRCLWINQFSVHNFYLICNSYFSIIVYKNGVGTILEGAKEGRKRIGRERLEYVEQITDDVGCSGCCDIKIVAQDRNKMLSRMNM